jgi:LysR family nitrogen assimilation transcriptional regulator
MVDVQQEDQGPSRTSKPHRQLSQPDNAAILVHGVSLVRFQSFSEKPGMDLKQIRYFVAIVDYGSLTKAANHLRIAQPALSLQVSNLEAECGAQLLIRTAKGVIPTEIGKILYRHGRIMLRQLEQAREEMKSGVTTISGLVALGLPTTVTVPLAMPLVRAVREQYPGIRLQLFESLSGYLSELLANNRLDFAVLFRDMETRSISVSPLVRETLHLIGDCGLSDTVKARDTCSLSELHGVPLVLPSSAHDLRLTVERAFAQAGTEANIVADIDSPRTMISIALNNVACTILPLSAIPLSQEAVKDLRTRRIVTPEITRTMSLCRLENTPRSPAAAAVEKVIVSLVPQLVTVGEWPGVTLLGRK